MFCQGVTAEGVLSSPNYPGKYPNKYKKTKTIEGANATVLVLEFTAFDIESHTSCRFDYLKIRDGDGTTLMGKTCGSSLPAKIISRSNIVYLDFKTNGKGRRTGWKVVWHDTTPGDLYDQHFNLEVPVNNFSVGNDIKVSRHKKMSFFLGVEADKP